jgi:hypothetical protein
MKIQHPLTHLWDNIAALMLSKPDQPGLLDRVQARTGLGRGIIQRIKNGPRDLENARKEGGKEPSLELKSLVAIASAFEVETWELLRPQRQAHTAAREFILTSLAESLDRLSDDELVSLVESVKLAIAQKRNSENTGAPHDPVRVYFHEDRRQQDIPRAGEDRRGSSLWKSGSSISESSAPPDRRQMKKGRLG